MCRHIAAAAFPCIPKSEQPTPDVLLRSCVEIGNLAPVLVVRIGCMEARQGLFQAEACLKTCLLNPLKQRLQIGFKSARQGTRAQASSHPPHTRPIFLSTLENAEVARLSLPSPKMGCTLHKKVHRRCMKSTVFCTKPAKYCSNFSFRIAP